VFLLRKRGWRPPIWRLWCWRQDRQSCDHVGPWAKRRRPGCRRSRRRSLEGVERSRTKSEIRRGI